MSYEAGYKDGYEDAVRDAARLGASWKDVFPDTPLGYNPWPMDEAYDHVAAALQGAGLADGWDIGRDKQAFYEAIDQLGVDGFREHDPSMADMDDRQIRYIIGNAKRYRALQFG